MKKLYDNTDKIDELNQKINIEQEEIERQTQQKTIEAEVESHFFYTNDKFFEQYDGDEIMSTIVTEYPALSIDNPDPVIKKALIQVVNDEDFIEKILTFYQIDVFQLFKIFHKVYGTIFKGPFVKKLKTNLNGKSYIDIKPTR